VGRTRLLLDEDTPLLLAQALRARGYDAIHALEVGLRSQADTIVLEHGIAEGRAVMTHNVKHYVPLVAAVAESGKSHHGLFLAPQLEFRDLLARTLHVLTEREEDDLTDAVIWV
jgi:hypothetical protein